MRIALGVSYRGTAYQGWQAQSNGSAVQNFVERAITQFCAVPGYSAQTHCAGRTDAGVHGVNQVLHFDCDLQREPFSWLRGTNAFLPDDIRIKWARVMPEAFHARFSATRRRYRYLLNQGSVAPALATGLAGWVLYPLDGSAMRGGAAHWLGEHDFSVFRSSQCQAKTPVKTLSRLDIEQHGAWWVFTIEANAFLHHMVRNMLGALLHIGVGKGSPDYALSLLACRDRKQAPPTFSAAGLYLDGVLYPPEFGLDALTWSPVPSEPSIPLFITS